MLVELIIATIIIIFIELYYQKSEVKENENNKMQQNEKIENPKSKIKELTNLDLLVEFIKYMGTFAENKVLA